jgi:hypothetical protein
MKQAGSTVVALLRVTLHREDEVQIRSIGLSSTVDRLALFPACSASPQQRRAYLIIPVTD